MSIKKWRSLLGFVPCILMVVCYFIYSYGSVNPDTSIGLFVATVSNSYQTSVEGLSSFLSLGSNKNYLENVAIVEEEDVERIKEEKAMVALMNAKKGIADLNNWCLPIVGNYTITTYYESYHRAIDYYSYEGYGSAILAANNGTVYSAYSNCVAGNSSCNGGRGNYVVINHNNSNYYTMYMHLYEVNVDVGDIVSGGDVIGSMGNTGYVIPAATSSNPFGGTHLHFEVYIGIPDKGGYQINPLSLY